MPLTLEESLDLQRQFASHIRHPEKHQAPVNIEDDRMQVYRELFFSSLTPFLDDTYEVVSQLCDDWRALNRAFFDEFQAQSPYFHRISNEFLLYLQQKNSLHPALLELALYEQRLFDAEVLVCDDWEQLKAATALQDIADADLLQRPLQQRQGLALEGFEYDVAAMLSATEWQEPFAEKATAPQFFAFFRDQQARIQTILLAPMTMALMELFAQPQTPLEVLQSLADATGMPLEQIQPFGLDFIRQALGQTLIFQDQYPC